MKKSTKEILLSFKELLLFIEEVNGENIELLDRFFSDLREDLESGNIESEQTLQGIQSHDFILQKNSILQDTLSIIKKQIEVLDYIDSSDADMEEEYLNMCCQTLDKTISIAKKSHNTFKHLNSEERGESVTFF
jgi:hypothetical protein